MRWQMYLKEVKRLKLYIISTVAVIGLSYSVYLFFDDETIWRLAKEDGFFENLTAVFFVFGAVLLFLSFRRTKNIFLLGLAVLLLIGAGEEISWGQRIFNFRTPGWVHKVNVQNEFNIHNIETFNDRNFEGHKKTGWQRLTEINMLFRIFSVIFLVCMPLFFFHMKPLLVTNKKRQMPVAPVTIGIFFIVSWAIFYGLKYFILPRGKVEYFYLSAGEIFEFTAAYIYFIVALYFYSNKNDSFLGKDIKQTIA